MNNITVKVISVITAIIIAISVFNAVINAGRTITSQSAQNSTSIVCAQAKTLTTQATCPFNK